jgi:hypothetical protein
MKKQFTFQNTIVFFLFPLIGVLLIPYFQYELNPDAISYYSIAEKYHSGNFKDAVNGYWAPLFSWALVPFLFLKVPAIIAGKIIGIISGMILLICLKNMGRELLLSELVISFLLVVSTCVMLPFIFVMTSPDLMMSAILLFYIHFTFSEKSRGIKTYGITIGVLGALAYFCKYFGLFFFIGHFTLISLLFYLSEKSRRQLIVKKYVFSLLVFLCLSSLWVATLSIKYQQFTISTNGKYNFTLIGPDVADHKVLYGFIEPSNSTALSAWEDPGELHYPEWNPLASYDLFVYYIKRVYYNLHILCYSLTNFTPIVWLVLAISLFLILTKNEIGTRIKNYLLWILITIFFYSGCYGLIFYESRYLYPVYFLFLVLLCILIQNPPYRIELSKTKKIIFLSALTILISYSSTKSLFQNLTIDKDKADIANQIRSRYAISGNIASDAGWSWFNSLYLCYHLKCRYYGAAPEGISKSDLLQELKKYKINYYIDWGEKDPYSLEEHKELTKGSIPELRIYEISE